MGQPFCRIIYMDKYVLSLFSSAANLFVLSAQCQRADIYIKFKGNKLLCAKLPLS